MARETSIRSFAPRAADTGPKVFGTGGKRALITLCVGVGQGRLAGGGADLTGAPPWA